MPSNLPIDGHSFRRVEVLSGAAAALERCGEGDDCRGEPGAGGGDQRGGVAPRAASQSTLQLAAGVSIGRGRRAWHTGIRFCTGGGGKPRRLQRGSDRDRDRQRDRAGWRGGRSGFSRRGRPAVEDDGMIPVLSGTAPAGVRVLIATPPSLMFTVWHSRSSGCRDLTKAGTAMGHRK